MTRKTNSCRHIPYTEYIMLQSTRLSEYQAQNSHTYGAYILFVSLSSPYTSGQYTKLPNNHFRLHNNNRQFIRQPIPSSSNSHRIRLYSIWFDDRPALPRALNPEFRGAQAFRSHQRSEHGAWCFRVCDAKSTKVNYTLIKSIYRWSAAGYFIKSNHGMALHI